VPPKAIPYNDQALLPREDTGLVDSTGVRMFRAADGKIYNHPVAQAQYGLALLNTYRVTRDAWFLDRARRQAQRLIDTHVESRGAWWYPYPFAFDLNGNPDDILYPPWYSGMAQGQALSLFTRLADTTGSGTWSAAADATFASLLLDPAADTPWGVHVDGGGYLWLEEYPRWPVDHSERVLNGHVAALYGVWDYWRRTGSVDAVVLFDGAATTAARYVPNGFRNPGWASSYSLRGDKPHESNHAVHVSQLLHLHALAAAPVFAGLAEMLHTDFTPPVQPGTVRFQPTAHTGVKFDSSGKVTASKTVRFSKVSTAPADRRRRILTQSGYWYRLTAGAFAGMWVQERYGYRTMNGAVARINYLASRRVQLLAGTYSAYNSTGSRTATFTATTSAPVSAMSWWNGRRSVFVSGGSLAGYWLPLTSATALK
jgi:hypothetical protein